MPDQANSPQPDADSGRTNAHRAMNYLRRARHLSGDDGTVTPKAQAMMTTARVFAVLDVAEAFREQRAAGSDG